MSSHSDYQKIILIGGTNTGKTTMINRFMGDTETNFASTSGITPFFEIEREIEGITYYFSINDTAGQEKFDSITKLFYQGSKGIIYVTTSDNEKSDEINDKRLEKIIETVHNTLASGEYVSAIAINKSDLHSNDQEYLDHRTKSVLNQFQDETNKVFLTSAINCTGLEELFQYIFKQIILHIQPTSSDNIQLDNDDSENTMTCECH